MLFAHCCVEKSSVEVYCSLGLLRTLPVGGGGLETREVIQSKIYHKCYLAACCRRFDKVRDRAHDEVRLASDRQW